MEIVDILKAAVKYGASDAHIVPKSPPILRIHGKVTSLNAPALTAEDTKRMVFSLLSEEQKTKFEEELELDCSVTVEDLSRFRLNVLCQKDGVGGVFRVIPARIPAPEAIGLTPTIMKLTTLDRGMVLVTGPTGSGKSTTLACLVNSINLQKNVHIITIEDPIEYVYEAGKSIITQRELGMHTKSFAAALKHALREDPDVVLVGEMRDLETIGAALTLSETGHLVFATLHTTDAAQTVDRIIEVFPPYQQQQVRMQLSLCLQAVICQQLLPTTDRASRVAAREVMMVTPAISNLIREGKTFQIYSAIETGSSLGMTSMDKALAKLVQEGKVTREDALAKANNPEYIEVRARTAPTPRV